MSAVPVPLISSAEYLRMERLAQFMSEYHRGQVVAMSGASRIHNRIGTNLIYVLESQLRRGSCNVYSSELRVSVRGGESYLYPDIVVTCRREQFQDDRFDTLVNPILVIEILSASTEGYDRGAKFLDYQAVPSLREYVLITQSPRRFEIYRRQADGAWLYQSWAFSPPPLVLHSVDCTLSADDVYFKVDDEAPEDPSHDEPDPV